MKTAKLIGKLTSGWQGDARLYRLSEPVSYADDRREEKTDTVIVSATYIPWSGASETMIFPALNGSEDLDETSPANWLDLAVVHEIDHEAALKQLGYTVEEPRLPPGLDPRNPHERTEIIPEWNPNAGDRIDKGWSS